MSAPMDLRADDLHDTLVAFYALVENEPLRRWMPASLGR